MASEGFSGRASGGQLEEKVDLSEETAAKLAQATTLAVDSNNLPEALNLLFALEKRCRVGNDNASLSKVCAKALELCRQVNAFDALLSTLQTLAQRRSQKTSAIKTLVSTAMPWCVVEPYTPIPVVTEIEKQQREQLVVALREITTGKIFLEKERAILTRVLATIKEQEGDVATAADVLQEVHVETYGSLSKRDKVEFILEQMRLCLAKQDYVRAAIVAGKISNKQLAELTEFQVPYYSLMTIYHRHKQDALALANDYHAMYRTNMTEVEQWKPRLEATVLFLTLSPYSNEQQDMLHRVHEDNNLEQLAAFQATVKALLRHEIISYPMQFQKELEALVAFQEGDLAIHWREVLHRRVIQHNLRVVAKYYQRIHLSRLAQLLQLDKARLELEIADMMSDGTLYAKMDRPNDIVRFSAPQTPESTLTSWARDIDDLLHLVETTTHLIHKEQMTSQ